MKALTIGKAISYCKNFTAKKGGYMYREQFDGVYMKSSAVFVTDTVNMLVCKTNAVTPTMFMPVGKGVEDRGYTMPVYEQIMPNLQDALAIKVIKSEDGLKDLISYWKDIFTLQGKLIRGESREYSFVSINLDCIMGLTASASNSKEQGVRATLLPEPADDEEGSLEMAFNPKYLVSICKVLASVNPCELTVAFMRGGLYIETEEQIIRWYCCKVNTGEEGKAWQNMRIMQNMWQKNWKQETC